MTAILAVKVVEFCAETKTSTVQIDLHPALPLPAARQQLENGHFRVLSLGNSCLLARLDRRLIHVYASGRLLVNLSEDAASAVRLLSSLFAISASGDTPRQTH